MKLSRYPSVNTATDSDTTDVNPEDLPPVKKTGYGGANQEPAPLMLRKEKDLAWIVLAHACQTSEVAFASWA